MRYTVMWLFKYSYLYVSLVDKFTGIIFIVRFIFWHSYIALFILLLLLLLAYGEQDEYINGIFTIHFMGYLQIATETDARRVVKLLVFFYVGYIRHDSCDNNLVI